MALNERQSGQHSDSGRDSGRDPVLDRVYARGARDEPPARLDDAIRAAARREVGARPRSLQSALRAWRMPVSLAAVMVLSVSVVLLLREEGADKIEAPSSLPAPWSGEMARDAQPAAPAAKSELRQQPEAREAAPVARDASTAPAGPAGDDSRSRKDQTTPKVMADAAQSKGPGRVAPEPFPEPRPAAEPRRAPEMAAQSQAGSLAKEGRSVAPLESRALERQAPSPPVAAEKAARDYGMSAPEPKPYTERPAAGLAPQSDAGVSGESDAEAKAKALREGASRSVMGGAQPMAVPPPPAKPAPRTADSGMNLSAPKAAIWSEFERQPPDKWIERIEELRRTGRQGEARDMLDEFKKRFPGYQLPANLAK